MARWHSSTPTCMVFNFRDVKNRVFRALIVMTGRMSVDEPQVKGSDATKLLSTTWRGSTRGGRRDPYRIGGSTVCSGATWGSRARASAREQIYPCSGLQRRKCKRWHRAGRRASGALGLPCERTPIAVRRSCGSLLRSYPVTGRAHGYARRQIVFRVGPKDQRAADKNVRTQPGTKRT